MNYPLPEITHLFGFLSFPLLLLPLSYWFLPVALFDEITRTQILISRSASGKPDPRHHLSTFYSSFAAYLISAACFPELGPGPYSLYRYCLDHLAHVHGFNHYSLLIIPKLLYALRW